MPNFLTTWLRYREHARRGRLLEQAVERVAGNLQMVDATLLSLVKSETVIRLSVRRQVTADIYGLFLPCRIEKKAS